MHVLLFFWFLLPTSHIALSLRCQTLPHDLCCCTVYSLLHFCSRSFQRFPLVLHFKCDVLSPVATGDYSHYSEFLTRFVRKFSPEIVYGGARVVIRFKLNLYTLVTTSSRSRPGSSSTLHTENSHLVILRIKFWKNKNKQFNYGTRFTFMSIVFFPFFM